MKIVFSVGNLRCSGQGLSNSLSIMDDTAQFPMLDGATLVDFTVKDGQLGRIVLKNFQTENIIALLLHDSVTGFLKDYTLGPLSIYKKAEFTHASMWPFVLTTECSLAFR